MEPWKILVLGVIIVAVAVIITIASTGGKDGYDGQLALVSGLADERYQGRANYQDAIDNSDMSPDEYCLANFYTIGCRFAGYLGPFQQGYFSPEAAVRAARH